MIKKLIKASCDEVTLAKVSSQPQSTYEVAYKLTEFELKKILLNKMEKNESYLTAPKHRDSYDGVKKSYALDKDFFFSYDVYSLKRSRKVKDKDEDPSVRSGRGLKKRKLSKDVEPTTGPKKKYSTSGSSKAPSLNQNILESLFNERNQCSRLQTQTCNKIKKGIWVIMKMKQGIRLPLDVTGSRNLHHLKNPLTLTGILARLLRKDQPKIERYKAFSEKLDWENPKGGDYPFDLSKPLPLITHGNRAPSRQTIIGFTTQTSALLN
ncbi:hypothetical protein Tco_1237883 [Tanacetum coccineum]